MSSTTMKNKCDVCGITKDVECEVFTKATGISRIYHLCPQHLVEVYRRTIEDFSEGSEYKVSRYLQTVADSLIVSALHEKKLDMFLTDEGVMDIEKLNPKIVRRTSPDNKEAVVSEGSEENE